MKNQIRSCLTLLFVFVLLTSIAAAQSSGGSFAITQSVVSNGGGTSSDAGNTFSLVGTIGQSVVGTSVNAPLSVSAGFWTSQALTPTAAAATVSGRVIAANGRGIRNVRVTMTNAAGETRMAISTALGYYRFDEVPAGETYIFSVSAKRYLFSQPVQVRFINEDTDDINFIAVN